VLRGFKLTYIFNIESYVYLLVSREERGEVADLYNRFDADEATP